MLRIRPNTRPRKQDPSQNAVTEGVRTRFLTTSVNWLQCYMSFFKRKTEIRHIMNGPAVRAQIPVGEEDDE